MPPKDLPEDLAQFRDSYVELFGSLPPLPAARFEFSGEINPEFLRRAEALRRRLAPRLILFLIFIPLLIAHFF